MEDYQFPPHSTQVGLDSIDQNKSIGMGDEKSKKSDRPPWSVEEDKVLAMAWVTISSLFLKFKISAILHLFICSVKWYLFLIVLLNMLIKDINWKIKINTK